ncbi:MAG: hypothetical protein LC796_03780 [Acidobacteria bacterium]|nr:hypothetical protein [Acidobacteriota bacterium]MCA1611540.1 hypothetical protein [Acidobacteriota bacterium]
MKRIREVAAIFALSAATAVLGQTTHTESTVKHTGAGPNTKAKTESVTGPVKTFEAGKKITVTGPGNKDYSFDLDTNAQVESGLAAGQTVTVWYTKESGGNKVTTVTKGAGKPMGAPMGAGAAGSTAKMGGQKTEAAVPAGGSMHMESTTKHTGPGPNTKVKTETVIGTVKTYDAGKKITVTGPKNKDYSFDLDENVSMAGSAMNVGDRVKVTYTKGDNGQKATTIAPYTGKRATRMKSKKKAA